ncbi:helix-turn-helix domain-containing protein [Kribbella sp. NPDC023972]|uniref:winged helix-turn-helix transcriptional regulator n=1 Tax=Kribbella sp. NPDC023972 TaxID=3154795 RepID=UPI0033F99A38
MRNYSQFCPIARSSELLAERWTPIIVRNLLNGCRTFNEIRQGAPGISTALLAHRLDTLERHGVLVRTVNSSGRGVTYEPTEMGLALRSVLDAMGQWGAQWLEIEPSHVDPAYVLWATLKLIDVDRIPAQTTVIRFELSDRPSDRYWLILRHPQPELCTRPSGYSEDIVCRTDSNTLVDLHLSRLTYPAAIRANRLELLGPPHLTRQFRSWFGTSPFAPFIPPMPTTALRTRPAGPPSS